MVSAVAEPILTDAYAILRLLPQGVLVVGGDWRVVYANPEADRMLGDSGATLWERCPGLEQTAFGSGFRYAMSDRTELLTESALPAIGWCQARALPTPEGGLLIMLRQVHAHTIETGQAKQALLIGEIGDALTREDSLGGALGRCALALVRHLGAALARIWTVDERAGILDLCASAGLELGPSHKKLRIGEHKIGQIAEDGEPYLTNDVQTDPHVGGAEWVARERLIAFAGYPLRIDDRIVGVMAMYSRNGIDHDMLNALSSIASALALGIERKGQDALRRRAEEVLRRQAGQLEMLHLLGQSLAAELDVGVLVQKVIDAATRAAGAQLGAFFYNVGSRSEQGFTQYTLATGSPDGAFGRLAPARNTALLAPTFIGVRAVRIDDIRASAPPPPDELASIASYLAVPVIGRSGRRNGTLLFGHDRPAMFNAETERVVESIAVTAAIAMDNARLFQEARDLISALEKSNRELDQFAYVASHDLKAPLRGIANLSQWIEDDLGERMDDQAREHMHLLRGRVLRLENLIGGILAYSRAGRDRGDLAELDVQAVVQEAWELLAPPPTAHLVITGELPRLTASRTQVQQVFLNLIGNAVKYNPDRDVQIEIGGKREGAAYEFFVRDDGIGIPPEFQDKIWALFQTLERRDKLESTGIGLSVVRKIVEAHGGRTWVESKPGAGATFYFTWPIGPVEVTDG